MAERSKRTRGRNEVEIRGLMLDPARLTERHEFYFDLLPDLAEWGVNTIWWHFVDDGGFALKLQSHPELATPFAFSRSETQRFIAEAAAVGIDVVPEVESLGHARYITRLPQYAHLADGDRQGFNAVCPSNPDTLRLLDDILTEVAELFPSPWLHVGLDEVSFAECRRCSARTKGKKPWWLYVEHTKAIHAIATRLGKRMIMWADHVEKDPAMLDELPTDITLCHWNYWSIPRDAVDRSLKAGFEVILAPALCFHGHVLQPHANNFVNMDGMTALAREWAARGVRGVVNTWWCPYRSLRDANLLALAYTGQMLRTGKPTAKVPFVRKFCREYFGVDDAKVPAALWKAHELTLRMQEMRHLFYDTPADVHRALNLAASEGFPARTEALVAAAETLEHAADSVTAHRPAFDAAALAARLAATALENALRLQNALTRYEQAKTLYDRGYDRQRVLDALDPAADILKEILDQVSELTDAVDAEWNRTRHPSDAKKDTHNLTESPGRMDALLARLTRHRAYLRHLDQQAQAAIHTFRRTGAFPT